MALSPDRADETRRRVTEQYRLDRRKRLDALADDVRRWMAEGRSLMYRIQAEQAGDETTRVVRILPNDKPQR
jgi:hypothetical protein